MNEEGSDEWMNDLTMNNEWHFHEGEWMNKYNR